MELSIEQRHALEQGQPIHVNEGGLDCVVLLSNVYERLKTLICDDSPLTAEERRRLLVEAGKRAGWDDPEMDIYNDLA
jgi:hypothetical protein